MVVLLEFMLKVFLRQSRNLDFVSQPLSLFSLAGLDDPIDWEELNNLDSWTYWEMVDYACHLKEVELQEEQVLLHSSQTSQPLSPKPICSYRSAHFPSSSPSPDILKSMVKQRMRRKRAAQTTALNAELVEATSNRSGVERICCSQFNNFPDCIRFCRHVH